MYKVHVIRTSLGQVVVDETRSFIAEPDAFSHARDVKGVCEHNAQLQSTITIRNDAGETVWQAAV